MLSFVATATLRHLRRAGAGAVVALLLGALAILVAGTTVLGLEALDRQTAAWRAELRIVAVLREPPPNPDGGAGRSGIVAAVRELPGVASARYVSPDAALEELRRFLGVPAAELDRLPGNPVAARVEVTPASGISAGELDRLVGRLAELPGVTEVQAAGTWLRAVERVGRAGRAGGLALGALLGLGTVLALAAATRAAVRASADEAAVLDLAGARRVCMWAPPLGQAMVLGAVGAALGLLALALLARPPTPWLGGWVAAFTGETTLPGLTPRPAGGAVGLGLASGLLGGLLGRRRARAARGPLGVAVAAALLLAGPAAAGPQAAARPRAVQSLRAQREALGEVKKKLEAAQARASAAREKEVSLLAELEQVDRTMARKRAELERVDREIRAVERELAGVQGRRGRVAEDTVVQQAALTARLQALDRLWRDPAPPAPWPAGTGPAAAVERTQRAADLRAVIRQDLGRLGAFEATAGVLDARRAAADRARLTLVALRRAGDAERAALDAQAARRRALLDEVRGDRVSHERLAGELAEAAGRLEALVRELARRPRPAGRVAVARPAAPDRPSPPAVGLGALRGQLPWPAEGRLLAGFGRQVHPRFGTETIRHGIDIGAPEGATVRAVHAGTVLHRGALRGYGNLVVLDHGQGYYTVYAHLAEILVDEGDRVTAGQGVGRVGETGAVEGPRLYFEVRYQGRAEDPEAWLRRRS